MSDPIPNLWQTHAIKFLEAAFRTDRREILHQPDGYGKHTIGCGDTLEIYLIIKNERIRNIAYTTNGCINTNACANAVIDLAAGRRPSSALKITPQMVVDYLQSLPEEHFHCAELAVGALQVALADVYRNRQTRWKKAYR